MSGFFDNPYILTYRIMRLIGRLAFPLYCFMLVEGFHHTRDAKKYMVRLFALAIISEIPFDLAIFGKPFYLAYNNVIWTLLIGLLGIYLIDKIRAYRPGDFAYNMLYLEAPALIVFLAALAGYALHTDYGAAGAAGIVLLYLIYRGEWKTACTGLSILIGMVAFASSNIKELAALLILIPIYFYHGKKGEVSRGLNRFFYIFYPLHLAIIAIVIWIWKVYI